MTRLDAEAWAEANGAYLRAAVDWVHWLLAAGRDDERTLAAAEACSRAAAIEPPPALVDIGDRFGLSPFERDVLLLCVAMELDTELPQLCAEAQGATTRSYPTFGLAAALFDGVSWAALSPQRPLRYWRLIEIHQPGAQPLTTSALRADERIVAAAVGLSDVDDRVAMLATPLDDPLPPGAELSPSQAGRAAEIVRKVRALAGPTASTRRPPPLQLVGVDGPSKLAVAYTVARELGLWLYQLPAAALPMHAGEVETLARLWEREAYLLPVALYVDARDADPPPLLARFLARANGLILLDVREAHPGLGDGSTIFEIGRPLPREQEAAWAAALGAAPGRQPTSLATLFSFDAGTIHRLAAEAGNNGGLEAICRRTARLRMQGLAQRVEPRARLEQVVLPPEPKALLEQMLDQTRHRLTVYDRWGFRERLSRGLGISALFAGESGTGKTMAAEAMAHELCLDLYRIDLSAVVSKYIGETEKNIRRVFDAAEAGGGILFFDEADALFGKRTEVKDSHDRYANIEVNYLLQRMEEYDGVAILATNMKSALDPAFLRRLRFVVNFPFPSAEDRRRIWQQAFPPHTARELTEQDWDRLARLNLTGGHIANIALNAAFSAAAAGLKAVTLRHILDATRAEFVKLERADQRGRVSVRGALSYESELCRLTCTSGD